MPGLYDYEVGRIISGHDYSFYALIQAAMRMADGTNHAKLAYAFPEEAEELQARYDAPGGVLPTDPPHFGPGALER
jgi:hypothetical protein